MTNEELIRQYCDGDEAALDKLYRRNLGLIRSIAKEAASEFNCLHMDRDRPEEFSVYPKTMQSCERSFLSMFMRWRRSMVC